MYIVLTSLHLCDWLSYFRAKVIFFLMKRPPPKSTPTCPRLPHTTLFRSVGSPVVAGRAEPTLMPNGVPAGAKEDVPSTEANGTLSPGDRKSTRLNSSH